MDSIEPLLFKVVEVAALLAISPTKVYQFVRDGRLRAVRVGGAIRIPRESVTELLTSLEPVRPASEAVTVAVP